jgi:hypothetical protein
MAYTRQPDHLNFVVNNYSDEEDNTVYDPRRDYIGKSLKPSNDPFYPKVDPLSHPS